VSRLVAVIVEVSDLERSAALYRDGFGVELSPGNNEVDDRWIGGDHAEVSWYEGSYFHFALYPAHGQPSTRVQLGLSVDDLAVAHDRAVAAGAEVVHPPRPEPWGITARYLDFDGNVIGLTQSSR
jgi:predicted enzyme related to lactoylglutathione lyase